MSKSHLTIQKELIKEAYSKSPLGVMERRLNEIHDTLYLGGKEAPEDVLKEIDKIRTENEKKQIEYIEFRLKTDREVIDDMLLESMTKEVALLEPLISTTNMNDK